MKADSRAGPFVTVGVVVILAVLFAAWSARPGAEYVRQIETLPTSTGGWNSGGKVSDMWAGPSSRWESYVAFYGTTATGSQSALNCSALPGRDRRSGLTVRPPQRRIVIDAGCKPTPDMLDAGVCVQMTSSQRKEIGCLPSLIIFGFQKCGTGELQGWLSAHPAMHRWQGNLPQKSGAGEADFFNRVGTTAARVAQNWNARYVQAGFMLSKVTDVSHVYTFEKSPKYEPTTALLLGACGFLRF